MNKFTLHPGQSDIVRDLFSNKVCRYAVVCAARGFGKSYVAAVTAIMAAAELVSMPEDIPNKNVPLVAPTHQQAMDIYYPLLAFELGLNKICYKSSKYTGKFILPNNVLLKLWSYESCPRMRGSGQYYVVCDEVTDWKGISLTCREAWESIIQPCIITRWSRERALELGAPSPGRALIISTPRGHDYFYDQYNFQHTDDDWKSYHYDYKDSPYLDVAEIEKMRNTIDDLKFKREYLATFEDSGSTVFYNFSRSGNVLKDIETFKPSEDVHVAIDFNVNIMAAVAFAIRGGQIHIIDEFQGHSDTSALAMKLISRYDGHKIYAYPDPTGRSSKTSAAGKTDFSILSSPPFGFSTLAKKKAPAIIDSVAAVNRMLKTADGKHHLFIHPSCNNTIKSFERTVWAENNPDLAKIDKRANIEHWTDGIRYAVDYLFPIQTHRQIVVAGFNF